MSEDDINHVSDRLSEDIGMMTRVMGEDSFSMAPYRKLPQKYLGLGGGSFAKGDVENGRREFATGALYGRQLIRVYRNRWGDSSLDKGYFHGAPVDSSYAVYGAFLSGDPRVIEALDTDLTALDEQVNLADYGTVPRYLEMDLLFLLYRGDDDAAATRIERLQDEVDRDLEYTMARHRIHEALVDGDASAVEDTLQAFVDSYRDILEHPDAYWRLLISHEAATYHLLARHLDLDISVDSDEIPVAVESYELGEEIELPEPEHVDEDLIPEQ